MSKSTMSTTRSTVSSLSSAEFSTRRKSDEFASSLALQERYTSSYIRQSDPSTVASLTINKLQFDALDLIGRDQELELLQTCLDRCCAAEAKKPTQATRELVFISGQSGTGKTQLARHFVMSYKTRRLQWGIGKFDCFFRDEPLSAFLDAFQHLCVDATEKLHQQAFASFRASLLDAFDDQEELQELIRMIPYMEQVVSENRSSNDLKIPSDDEDVSSNSRRRGGGNSEGNSQRMTHLMKKLCRVLAHHFAPLVIILDDLQWADQASLALLEALMNDNENSKILFLACYRSDDNNTVDVSSYVANLAKAHSNSNGSNITEMEIGNLSLPDVNTVVSTLLAMEDDADKTMELAKICHRRSLGNVFFLVQFVVMLKEEDFLEFDLGLFRWKWDLHRIKNETAATANLVAMVTSRLTKLPPEDMSFLQLVACLGSTFHDRTVSIAWSKVVMRPEDNDEMVLSQRPSLDDMLDTAKRYHFVEDKSEPGSHQWLHDSIQEAALGTIPQEDLDGLKHRLGMALLAHLSPEDLSAETFVVANLLATYKPKPEETDGIIDLFLSAAQKATTVAAFQSSLRYSKAGIALSPTEDSWVTHHERTLRLYSIATEAAGFLGLAEDMIKFSSIVLNHPECSVLDKLPVNFVKLQYLQNNGEAAAALELGLQTLKSLGCSFPRTKLGQVLRVLSAVRKFGKNRPTLADIKSLPLMIDERKKAIVKIIFLLEACFYYTKEIFLYAVASAKTVELVLEYGICDYSAGGFFALGIGIASLSADPRDLTPWCDLSLTLADHDLIPSGYHESRSCFATSVGLAWSQPVRNLPKTLLRGYKAGMKVGDTESAMWNCCHSIYTEFMCGKRLFELEERCERYVLHMEQLLQNEILLLTASMWRLISKLIGKESYALSAKDAGLESSSLGVDSSSSIQAPKGVSTGNKKRASLEAILSQDIARTSPVFPHFDRVAQNMLLAYERKYVDGAEMSIKRGNEFLGNFPFQAIAVWDIFLRGVCLFGAARETKTRKYKRQARKIRATVDKWLDQGNPNVRHHSALLAAEDNALRGKFKEAQRSYESAIAVASRGGYVHDRAIAHERYALHLLEDMEDYENAEYHGNEADRMYKEWGANALCRKQRRLTPASISLK